MGHLTKGILAHPAPCVIGDSEEHGVRLVHTIKRKIVEPDAK